MDRVLSLSLGEVVLKGKNRGQFVRRIVQQIKNVLYDLNYGSITQEMGKIYVEIPESQEEEIIRRLEYVFGIVYIVPSWRFESSMDKIIEMSLWYMGELLATDSNYKTFKVETKRADKSFPLKSPEINSKLGAEILKQYDHLKVDVHNPDILLQIDIRKDAYIYHEKIATYGGMPLGSNGNGLLLLSGGIDSPVAGFLMAKRGVSIDGLHFHSYPFTSKRSEEKVLDLARVLSRYTLKMRVHSVNIYPIQKQINKYCPEEEMTVLSRRFMMRIANALCNRYNYDSIITGESLGQVASQTIEGITVTNDVAERLVFRPLVGMDKVDIIRWSESIGTYDISIEPFDDCCTLFLPKHPVLHPTVEEMERSESVLDIEGLVEEVLETAVVHKIEVKED